MKFYKDAARKTYERDQKTSDLVREILENVQRNGDAELLALTKKFDGIDMDSVKVSREQIANAYTQVSAETVAAIKAAAAQIRYFAEKQLETIRPLTTATPVAGVTLGHRLIPVQNVGIYVPAGRYPLPSTALMLTIPAKVAGVEKVVACSPAFKGFGTVHPAVLVAMDIAGVDEIYCTGGAQAIAAMAFGTETVKKVDLIAGPGNRFVAEAKRQVLGSVGIDSIAGPSEVLVIADEMANPRYTAIDLLAQSEHDPNARATLITTSEKLAADVLAWIKTYAGELSTGETALKSWEDNGTIFWWIPSTRRSPFPMILPPSILRSTRTTATPWPRACATSAPCSSANILPLLSATTAPAQITRCPPWVRQSIPTVRGSAPS